MSNFLDVVSRIFRPYKRYALIISLIVLFLVVAIYGFNRFYSHPLKTKDFKDVANANRRDPNIEIYLFWAEWCPHCKKAKPDWVAFQQEYNGKNVNGYTIKCVDVDCSDDTKAEVQNMLAQYKVSSYPTVVGVKNADSVDFDAKITKSSLDKFVESLTQK
jgi:thiol-disulfide isomerase/thioredoxin